MRAFNWARQLFSQKLIVVLLIISIIPVLGFGTTMYVTGSRIVESEVSRSSQMAITQVRDQMDRLVSQVEKFSSQFSAQSNVMGFMEVDASPTIGSLPQSNTLINDISNFVSSMPALHSAYLYHAKQQIVLGGGGAWRITNVTDGLLTDKSWLPILEEAVAQRKLSLWITPRVFAETTGASREVITYMQMLPFFYSEMKAALIVNIDTAYLVDSVSSYPFGAKGKLLIFGPDGTLIAQGGPLANVTIAEAQTIFNTSKSSDLSSPTLKLDGDDMYAQYEVSTLNGWTYAMLIPEEATMHSVELLKKLIMITTLILCFAALLVFFFSYNVFQRGLRRISQLVFGEGRNSKPSSKDKQQVFSYHHRVDEIEYRIAGLLDEVDDVKAEWQEQLPLLREQYLLSVLFGDLHSRSVENARVKPLFEAPYFSVIVIEMDNPLDGARFASEDARLFLFSVANISKELMKSKIVGETVLTSRHAVILLNLQEDAIEHEPTELAQAIRYAVEMYLKQSVTLAIGRTVDNLYHVALSYNDALKTIQDNWFKQGNEVISYRDAAYPLNETFIYPSDIEKSILEQLRDGNAEGASHELDRFGVHLKQEGITLQLMKTYYVQLLVSMIRVLQEYEDNLTNVFGNHNPYADLVALESTNSIQDWFKNSVIIPIIAYIQTLRKNRTKGMIDQTKEFIADRYAQDLSLQFVADYFRVSPSYLSQLFKKEVGDTFINYVIRYRIERVKELLLESELSIAKISEEVGYSNAQQLIRVFKKLEGMTPGEFRESQLKYALKEG
ncbi:helix-turn-helix domain-containing protein [Paenibacillus qinlingensis]|uniref:AraC-like DNA-binding protein n=1 Tax=Paenibacillus qinlingensis TaxID=1837343 RepID=A0ABU1NTU3_9BACL|nr:helix-turn-helix domain-containing protein [Paenibacillus qinlingensis]MDR6550868.1 AraC-like DNA-binding protein [Paenibacillus qinlingensis]